LPLLHTQYLAILSDLLTASTVLSLFIINYSQCRLQNMGVCRCGCFIPCNNHGNIKPYSTWHYILLP
jgi:hypothetical protein